MTKIREMISAHMGIVAGLFGVFSLFLLDFPFLVMTGGPYSVNLSSGLQIALEGTNVNPAEIVWESYPSQVYSDLVFPGVGFISASFVILVFMIVGGALIVEVAGFTTAALTDEGQCKSAGKLIAIVGGFMALISLISIIGILITFTRFQYVLNGTTLTILPGLAVFVELVVGIVIADLGFRLYRRSF